MVTSTLVSLAALVGAMAAAVGATLVVENWRRWRTAVPEATRPASDADAAEHPGPSEQATLAGDRDDAVVAVELVVADRAAADRLVAVLFASVAAGRGPDADRVAAWVTARDWPPAAFGGEFRPGADLRGRPAAVRRLLERDDDGRCWVTLRTSVDIAKGLRMRPPRGDELAGVVPLWAATRSARGHLDRDGCEGLAVALDRLEHIWAPTVASTEVLALRAAVAEVVSSAAPDATLTVEVSGSMTSAPSPVRAPQQPDGTRPDASRIADPVSLAS